MVSASRELLGRILNELEDLELPLLSWGVTEGTLSKDEVRGVLEGFTFSDAEAAALGATALLRELTERGLLFAVPDSSPVAYRTRLGEGLRLTTSLRQLFVPSDFADGWWQRYRSLVADYRLHVADRRYPRRDVATEEAVQSLAQTPGWTDAHAAVAQAGWGAYQLSAFQVRAADAVVRALAYGQSRAVIVGAGTGSGKTLAFYLPAFGAMAADRRAGAVHTLALYPRIELLRDQLREAVKTSLITSSAMPNGGVRIGVLYGNTPHRHRDVHSKWAALHAGFVCPYLACPRCGTGTLVWRRQDVDAGREILRCTGCGGELPEGLLALTRESIRRHTPKLLFTTTEMLNRNTAGSSLGAVLGWRSGNGPRLVLLDEIHTYSGATGAQTALLLRRWQFARRRPVTFVGLSATLQQADGFMAQLTGLPAENVELVEPRAEEMDHEGREYSLIIRGDPVSGVSLLSVSIQTAMLYGRLLDHRSQAPEGTSVFGTTGFVFTDDLDVTNRLYNILREAEGGQYGSGARPGYKRNGRILAALRAPGHERHDKRYRGGQSWDLPVRLGHNLNEGLKQTPLIVSRTSSQDAGFNTNANLVVATAALEVGFNDPRVGLVIQHKVPHDPASFLQRRGRAGRERGTRPTTVVVLSDFGRDGLAYRAYDSLFSPEVPARFLPVGNRHIVKIQGAQAFIDWLSKLLAQDSIHCSARDVVGRAGAPREGDELAVRSLTARLRTLLDGDKDLLGDLRDHLAASLQLDTAETQALLWEQPRSVMLAVAPTVLRRLEAGATPVRDDPGARSSVFLPEFVTKSLFASLNLPEVEFRLPFSEEPQSLPIAQALREAVPGKVSRRYGYADDRHSTWVPVAPGDSVLEIEAFIEEGVPQGNWDTGHPNVGVVSVIRPFKIRLSQPDTTVSDRSQGFPTWASEIVHDPAQPPIAAEAPQADMWKGKVAQVAFATHAAGNPVEVRRMTLGAAGNLVHEHSGQVSPYSVAYAQKGCRVALGFALTVDGLCIEVAPLDVDLPEVQEHLQSPQWRAKAFSQSVAEDPRLTTRANTFQLGWLSLVYLSAFALRGLRGEAPQEIYTTLRGGTWNADVPQIIRLLYRQSQEHQDEEQDGGPVSRVVADLQALSSDAQVAAALDELATLLLGDRIVERTAEIARRAYRDTFAAAALEAVLRICPDAQDGDLTIDVIAGQDGSPDKLWITETSIGGLGVIEALAGKYGEDPQRFWSLLAVALRPNTFEQTDHRLTALLRHIVDDKPDGDLAQAMAAMRRAKEAASAKAALADLRRAWTRLDGPPRHSDIAALAARLLRPGSTAQTDCTARALLAEWNRIEQDLGIEVDARVVAYTAGEGLLALPSAMTADQVFGILWPRGDAARNHHLQVYQPYRVNGCPVVLDRLLVASVHVEQFARISATLPGWSEKYRELLAADSTVELVSPLADPAILRDALLRVPLVPVDRGVLRLFGEVERVSRDGESVLVKVVLKEAER